MATPLTRIFKPVILQQVQDKFCGFKNEDCNLKIEYFRHLDILGDSGLEPVSAEKGGEEDG